MFDMKKIGERIREKRKACGITQLELAEKVGISCQAVSNWERGIAMPDIANLEATANLLGVTIDYIISDNNSVNDVTIPNPNTIRGNNCESFSFYNVKSVYESGNISIFCELLESLDTATLSRIFEVAYKDGNIAIVAIMIEYVSQNDIYNCALYAYKTNNLAIFAETIECLEENNISIFMKMAIKDNRHDIIAVLME